MVEEIELDLVEEDRELDLVEKGMEQDLAQKERLWEEERKLDQLDWGGSWV